MSSIGTGYDLAAATFSPDGRIFQASSLWKQWLVEFALEGDGIPPELVVSVRHHSEQIESAMCKKVIEYAEKAVDSSSTTLAMRGKDGVVMAIDKYIPSKLYLDTANPRMWNVNRFIGCGMAGVYPDCRAILDFAVGEALKYLKQYRASIPIQKLAQQVAEYVHIYTLGISRPFGSSIFFAAWDEKKGPKIFLIEPSGLCYEYKAWAVGKHRQAAKTEIEKLKLEELSMNQLVKEAVRIVLMVRDEVKDQNSKIEMGWVGSKTDGKFQHVPNEIIAEAQAWANAKLEEDDMEE